MLTRLVGDPRVDHTLRRLAWLTLCGLALAAGTATILIVLVLSAGADWHAPTLEGIIDVLTMLLAIPMLWLVGGGVMYYCAGRVPENEKDEIELKRLDSSSTQLVIWGVAFFGFFVLLGFFSVVS